MSQAVWILLDVLQSDGLGTDVTTAEGIVAISTDRHDTSILDLDL